MVGLKMSWSGLKLVVLIFTHSVKEFTRLKQGFTLKSQMLNFKEV